MRVAMNKSTFGKLRLGDTFRVTRDEHLYMKTENVSIDEELLLPNGERTTRINTVDIGTGIMLFFDDDAEVIKESGIFIRGNTDDLAELYEAVYNNKE